MAEHKGEMIGCRQANPVACMGCLNAYGEPPWEDSPTKSYCMAYRRSEGQRKPASVLYDGGECVFMRGAR